MSLIVCEGLDGAGTTTLAQNIVMKLHENDESSLLTSEPYDRAPSEQADVHEAILGFLHDRAKHCRELIQPYSEMGYTVVCDRYRDSTLAYQSHDLAKNFDKYATWKGAVTHLNLMHLPWIIEPDVTIYVDVPVETAMRRNDGDETYEELTQAKEVYDYLYYGEYHGSKTVIVDGTEPADVVADEAMWKIREMHSLYDTDWTEPVE